MAAGVQAFKVVVSEFLQKFRANFSSFVTEMSKNMPALFSSDSSSKAGNASLQSCKQFIREKDVFGQDIMFKLNHIIGGWAGEKAGVDEYADIINIYIPAGEKRDQVDKLFSAMHSGLIEKFPQGATKAEVEGAARKAAKELIKDLFPKIQEHQLTIIEDFITDMIMLWPEVKTRLDVLGPAG